MLKLKIIAGALLTLSTFATLQAQNEWQQKVKDELPLMRHRNWIVIVDSAYPLQSGSGVETVGTGQEQLSVLGFVLDSIKNSPHVRPIAHTDAELQYVPESEAHGVEQYTERTGKRASMCSFSNPT